MSKITILVDGDVARDGLRSAHGFAAYVERAGCHILFDTGPAGGALLENARKLDIALEKIEAVVLSHGHYDHVGGLAELFEAIGPRPVWLAPGTLQPRWSQKPGRPAREIGVPEASRRVLEEIGELRRECAQPREISKGLWCSGEIPRKNDFETPEARFFLDEAGTEPDRILDDQALWLDSSEGLVILVGCAHAGLINTLEQARHQLPGRPLRAVLGGFHLLHADRRRLVRTSTELLHLAPELIAPMHCSGDSCLEPFRETLVDSEFGPVGAGAEYLFHSSSGT
ncbi:MAG: MBL fold metallo-hydrolase [Planctomycetota bacterium]|nr:MAG: MBL fold metallo-hydrolase [Planctomycetota bacterium]